MPLSPQDAQDRISKGSQNLLLSFEIIQRDGNWDEFKGIQDLMKRIFNAVVNYPKISIQNQSEVCIVLTSDQDIQNLNLIFRGKNSPTNVLSFPSSKMGTIEVYQHMGDIVLARETIERESVESNISFSDHLAHLTIHGLLHLMGYDHETEREAQIMEALEIAILSKLGISDPYNKVSTAG